jgi:hypothetical protein
MLGYLRVGVLEISGQFDSWVYVDLGFLLRFFNYTLHESNCQADCQAELAELITLKVVAILLMICYNLEHQ